MQVESRRGAIVARLRADNTTLGVSIFMALSYVEAAANLLTAKQFVPLGKIPEFKYCAVRLQKTEARAA